ncbi:DUF420 domain-containing protein [Salibacterium salarium]|uniref:DUF420 domain-containing protein n=1 Tax=Salibacterium salarium TaxID=284579 RepID=A0A428MWF3_9BACI|nr:DUF420 domain-containing protein [Salibacterium salarium]RSL30379.1 DUF420 domain-containing protein [Salibacterium salarium]
MANVLPLLSTLCIIISAVFVAAGWYFIKQGKRLFHQRMMITGAVFAVLFLIIYISRTIFIGNTSFGGPAAVAPYYTAFLVFHICLAVTGLVFGGYTIRLAWKGRLMKHKKTGPWAAVIWFFSAATGVVVYLVLYVIWEPGPTTNLLQAIFG